VKPKRTKRLVAFWMPEELYLRLKRWADREERPIGNLLRIVLKKYLKEKP